MSLRIFGAILRKDVLSLYPLVSLVALLFAGDVIVMQLELIPVWYIFQFPVLLLAGATLAFAVVQSDAAVSHVDDWLCRPVPRAELLAAKLALLAAVLYGSRALAALLLNLILGASIAESLQRAFLLADFLPLYLSPIVLFSAMVTRTVVQGFGVLIAIAIAVFAIPTPLISAPGPLHPAIGTALLQVGMGWLGDAPTTLLCICLFFLGCWLVYWRRNIKAARVLLGITVLAAVLLVLLPMWLAPWQPVYAAQKALTHSPAKKDTSAVFLRHWRACFPATRVRDLATDPAFTAARQAIGVRAWTSEDLADSGPDSLVFLTSIEARRLPSDWRVMLLYVQADYLPAGNPRPLFSLRPATYETGDGGSSLAHAWVVPDFAVARLSREPQTELKLRYSLGLLEPHHFSLRSDGKQHAVPGLGWCSAKLNSTGSQIDVECFMGSERPAQISAELERIPATRVYGPPDLSPGWWRGLTGSSQKLTLQFPRLGRNDRVTVTAWTLGGYLDKSLTLPGILGGDTSSCPLPNGERQFQQSVWRDTAKHEVSSITVDEGVQLEVLDFGGSGTPIVLLPGLGATAHSFDELGPLLARKQRVFAITRRGSGYSSKPDFGFDTPRLAQDVLQVMDALKLEKVLLAGHSIAGEELTWLGGHHPQRFSGLVYLDAAYDRSHDPSTESKLYELGKRLPPEPPLPPEALRNYAAMSRVLAERGHVQLPEGELIAFRNVDKPFLAGTLTMNDRTLQASIAALEAPDYAALKIPALALYAIEDPDKPLPPWFDAKDGELTATLAEMHRINEAAQRRSIELFRQGVAQGEVLELRNAAHYIMQSNQQQVLEAIESFSEKVQGR